MIISRPTKWGNPFRIGVDGRREECVRQFGDWIVGDDPKARDLRDALGELHGKDLACWCLARALSRRHIDCDGQ